MQSMSVDTVRKTNRSRRFLLGYVLAAGILPSHVWAQSRQVFDDARRQLVDKEIVGAGITNPRVIEAMRKTPRHEFVPLALRKQAYYDMALPIGEGQTISPPFVVAMMTEAIDPQPTDKVLEIGTGSGYQAAVLSPLAHDVYTIEIVAPLGHTAAKVLKRLHYDNVHAKVDDGYQGWPEYAPFDKIIVTCSPEKVPPKLVEELKEGGRMVIPVGERYQQMMYIMKKVEGKLVAEALRPTLFVPMTGQAEQERQVKPDPGHPQIINGGFEQTFGEPPQPTAWHYQRQLQVVVADDSPEGKQFVRFTNSDAGRPAQALQGFAVDGRKVGRLEVSLQVRAKDIPGGQSAPAAKFAVTFYDEHRVTVGQDAVGAWRGTFAWRKESGSIDVPPRTREAIVHIGLLGATGELSLDDIRIKAVPK
jgi:protein-L-isoaspartate(D-aspartate) O-methyltransferase